MTIFQPFRALGLIADGLAWSLQRRGSETFLTLSVGHAWQIFSCAKLQLVFAGPQLDSRIRSLASFRDYTYAATGRKIGVCKRAQLAEEWDAHESKILLLLAFGHHLLSVDSAGQVYLWLTSVAEGQGALGKPVGGFTLRPNFTPTCIVHPETYLNKVLIGSEEGSLQLWNISTGKLVHEFKGWQTPIQCCVSSPALDVVGIGSGDGRLHLHNLKYDETVVSFTHTTKGPVTAISFRTDGQPLVAAGGSSGGISIWNLDKRTLHSVIQDAHDSEIMGLHYLADEPVLLSVGKDNAVKMWIFDSIGGEARLLRFRNGHSAPPTCICYYGTGRLILSAGQDRSFRAFSTIQDQQSREFSQGHVTRRAKKHSLKEEELKLPPVVAFAAASICEREWCNVVTCHDDSNAAFVWRLQDFVIGEHVLTPSFQPPTAVKACAISACGNYAVLGTASGCIERFNLQSGLSRGCYQDGAEPGSYAHAGAVTGLACDAVNKHLISCSLDASIKVWDFRGQSLESCLHVGSPLAKLVHHRGNGLVAAASDDMVIRLFDVVALRLVRHFAGHMDRITDLLFSEDGKWLISSAMDGTIRTWDVVGSKQLDAMHVDVAVTSLSLSPGMDMLATAHVNKPGIYLWANRLMYAGSSDPNQQGSGRTVVDVCLPTISSPSEEANYESIVPVSPSCLSSMDVGTKTDGKHLDLSIKQIVPELVTMAILPRHQWLGLVSLEDIKNRNKPLAPPKKEERAPFFLPSVSGVQQLASGKSIDPSQLGGRKPEETDLPRSRSSCRQKRAHNETGFKQILLESAKQENYGGLFAYMRTLEQPAVDFELRMLTSIDPFVEEKCGNQSSELAAMLDFFINELATNNNFELLQAWIQLFLKIHGETVNRDSYLQDKARTLAALQMSVWTKLDGLFQQVRCVIGFVSQVQE